MRACDRCFCSRTWLANASEESSSGTCDFGHGYQVRTWPTSAWAESVLLLVSNYQAVGAAAPDVLPLSVMLHRDWGVFALSTEKFSELLDTILEPDGNALRARTLVRLRNPELGTPGSQLESWTEFSREIRERNRYFPQTRLDRDVLKEALLGSVSKLSASTRLFRARVASRETVLRPKDMGAPPAHLATPGRANPVGIPYLYLATREQTTVYETRVANHSKVAIATFELNADLKLLDLADLEAPDFYSVENALVAVLYYRYLVELSKELRRPVGNSDQLVDYIPTQYLCELAKSSGLDGVIYLSSLDRDGRNVVLFDVNAAKLTSIKSIRVTELTATWEDDVL
jgi:hypothetical protein